MARIAIMVDHELMQDEADIDEVDEWRLM